MKKLIILAVALAAYTANAFAYSHVSSSVTVRILKSNSVKPFESIIINDDIDVVLTQADESRIEVRGDREAVANVAYKVKKNKLYIFAKSGSLRYKAVVYVSVSRLKMLEINGASRVSSVGILQSDKLKVFVNGEASLHIRNLGEVLLESDSDIDLKFENTSKPVGIAKPMPDDESLLCADSSIDRQFMNAACCADNS